MEHSAQPDIVTPNAEKSLIMRSVSPLLLFLPLLFLTSHPFGARQFHESSFQPAPGRTAPAGIISPGEELTYEVRWFKVRLGRIRLRTFPSTRDSIETIHHASATVDSYEGLPFVDVHARDRTDMDSLFYSRGFRAFEKKGDRWRAEISTYNLPARLMVVERSMHPTISSPPEAPPSYDTIMLPENRIQDGLSILYFARAHLHSAAQITVPTVVYGKLGRTHFTFAEQSMPIEIDALDDKRIRVRPFEGKAEFEGLYGLTGDFKGWFSDDEAAVPIKAEMKVLLGSVTIELVSWSRSGWQPPIVP